MDNAELLSLERRIVDVPDRLVHNGEGFGVLSDPIAYTITADNALRGQSSVELYPKELFVLNILMLATEPLQLRDFRREGSPFQSSHPIFAKRTVERVCRMLATLYYYDTGKVSLNFKFDKDRKKLFALDHRVRFIDVRNSETSSGIVSENYQK